MNKLLQQYFEIHGFHGWEDVKDHFEQYLNEEQTLKIEFNFFSNKVKWEISMHELKDEYDKYRLRKKWQSKEVLV